MPPPLPASYAPPQLPASYVPSVTALNLPHSTVLQDVSNHHDRAGAEAESGAGSRVEICPETDVNSIPHSLTIFSPNCSQNVPSSLLQTPGRLIDVSSSSPSKKNALLSLPPANPKYHSTPAQDCGVERRLGEGGGGGGGKEGGGRGGAVDCDDCGVSDRNERPFTNPLVELSPYDSPFTHTLTPGRRASSEGSYMYLPQVRICCLGCICSY